MKLELLAVKWAVMKKCREYLLGNHFTIFTHNNPLSHLQTTRLGAIEQQWASQLPLFNFTLKYHLGKNADALSRQYLEHFTFGTEVPSLAVWAVVQSQPASEGQCGEVMAFPGCSLQDLTLLQEAVPVILPVWKYHREGQCPRTEECKSWSSSSHVLVRQWARLFE